MRKKRNHTIIYYLTIWALVAFFIIVSTSLITMQTIWGKEKLKSGLITLAKKNDIDLKIGNIKGIIPFQYKMQNVSISYNGKQIDIQKLIFRIKFIPLLRNEFSFKLFQADTINFSKKAVANIDQKNTTDKTSITKTEIDWVSTPIKVHFDKLKLKDLALSFNDKKVLFNVIGKTTITKFGELINSKLEIVRKGYEKSHLDISFKAYKETRRIETKAYLNVVSKDALSFLFTSDVDYSFDINFETKGSLDTYLGYFYDDKKSYEKVEARAYGNIHKLLDSKTKKPLFFISEPSSFSFDLVTFENLNINLSKAFIINDLFKIYFDSILKKDLQIAKSSFLLRVDDLNKINLSPLHIFGSFNMKAHLENSKLTSTYDFQNFRVNDIPFLDFKGNVNGSYAENSFTGNITSSTFALNQVMNISSDLKFEKSFLHLSNLHLQTPSTFMDANLSITPARFIIGSGKFHFDDLGLLQVIYPKITFNGVADMNFDFKHKMENEKAIQNVKVQLNTSDYHLKNAFGKTSTISLDIDSPFTDPKMDAKITFKDLKFHDLNLSNVDITYSTKQENWPYEINMRGKLSDPLEIKSKGFFKIHQNEYILNIQDLKGHIFTHNFISPQPIKLEKTKEKFLLTDLSIELANSSIYANINFTEKSSKAQVNLKHFPLDFLSINPLDLDVSGFVTLDFELKKENILYSTLNIDLEKLKILALGEETPLLANGKLKSEIKNAYFSLDVFLHLKDTQLFSLKGEIPLDIDLVKLKVKPDDNKKLKLDLTYNGKVEEILDFINIGPQRLEGLLNSEIHLSDKIKDLQVDGYCTFQKGYYENYYTGTILKDINAKLKADNEKLHLEYLKAADLEKGTLYADGTFSISRKNNFPFYFNLQLNNLLCVDSDIIRAKASADIEVSGDRVSSLASGNVDIDQLQMTIPDNLPITIPDLKPTFVSHPYQEKVKEEKLTPAIYPIHLNFNIDARAPISIGGQGLSSTWKGVFKIGGTYMSLETKGILELIQGKFVFSGRSFELTKGRVTFTGKPNEMPNLDIQAKMNQQGVDIIANMQGPLDKPKIFFTSSPPLPASSIMSLLIFGQELSELSEVQTIELASTISQKMEETPYSDSESSLSNLGIDRFNIVQPSSTDPGASDQMAVQLGKYITQGVVVSFSQGEEQGSSNVIVEVDLKHGLIFQAETQQEKEQGKFSLKWRRNY